MGKAYSLDLRERVARHVADGGSRREAGRRFGVSASTAVRIAASQAVRGTLAPRRQGRPPGRGKLAPYIDFLVEARRGGARHHDAGLAERSRPSTG